MADRLLKDGKHQTHSAVNKMTEVVHDIGADVEPSDDLTLLALSYH